jgi:hypothetical protein
LGHRRVHRFPRLRALNPLFSIFWQVAEPAYYHQNIRGRSLRERELLRAVRIPSPAQRMRDYPHQMSGGMRQRIVGAIALAGGPKLIIADEPTTNLDVTIQAHYLDLLKDIQNETGVAIINSNDLSAGGVLSPLRSKIALAGPPSANATIGGFRTVGDPVGSVRAKNVQRRHVRGKSASGTAGLCQRAYLLLSFTPRLSNLPGILKVSAKKTGRTTCQKRSTSWSWVAAPPAR